MQRHDELLSELPARLLPWFDTNKRAMPWRGDVSAYGTWVSEIMLQQTRVEAVRDAWTAFMRALPDVGALAACSEDELLKLWEGLGYYSRARNLQRAAREIVAGYGGELPASRAQLARLPGIGDYTAGAIASIAFGLPEPAVDGNVLRILARITGDDRCADDPRVRAERTETLRGIYPPKGARCGDLTQALMELGAVVCVPNGAPQCGCCPVRDLCRARADGTIGVLPVRAKKTQRKREIWTGLVVVTDGKIRLRRRARKGLLAGMWEFPFEAGHLTAEQAIAVCVRAGVERPVVRKRATYTHIFTHKEWDVVAYRIDGGGTFAGTEGFSREQIDKEISVASAWRGCLALTDEGETA